MSSPAELKIIKLKKIAPRLKQRLKHCDLCPRNCGVDRLSGEKGACATAYSFKVASYNLHFGEEPCISGRRGSGTIFFANCPLGCVFCQNYPISHLGNGIETSVRDLAAMMIELQKRGAHNINLVTPTHLAPQICEALLLACQNGLDLPVVYNSSGYESLKTIRQMEGIIDIYMPDAKYFSENLSARYSGAGNYRKFNIPALLAMRAQVGDIETDENGIATKGLLIRHLVLPNCAADSMNILREIAEKISPKAHISIMAQYHPAFDAAKFDSLNRGLQVAEYRAVTDEAGRLGFVNGYRQEI